MPDRRVRVNPRTVKRAISKYNARGPNVSRATYKATININILAGPALTTSPEPQLPGIAAPRGALLYTQLSWEEFEGTFLGLMTYLDLKGKGKSSMSVKQRTSRRRRRWAAAGPARYDESWIA
jgi:hypothetical protein